MVVCRINKFSRSLHLKLARAFKSVQFQRAFSTRVVSSGWPYVGKTVCRLLAGKTKIKISETCSEGSAISAAQTDGSTSFFLPTLRKLSLSLLFPFSLRIILRRSVEIDCGLHVYWAYLGHGPWWTEQIELRASTAKMFSGLTNQVSSWMGSSKGEHQEDKVPTPVDDGSVNVNSEKRDIRWASREYDLIFIDFEFAVKSSTELVATLWCSLCQVIIHKWRSLCF